MHDDLYYYYFDKMSNEISESNNLESFQKELKKKIDSKKHALQRQKSQTYISEIEEN